jgi:hypothetical protein
MSALVISQEPKFEFEFIDGLQAIRHSLTASILKKIIAGFYTFDRTERDNLLGYISVDAMETGSDENALESKVQRPESDDQMPESDDQTPESDDQTPESDDQRPESDDQTPESDDQTPESDDQTPESDDQTPECDKNAGLDEKELFCSAHAPLLP